MTWAEAIAQLSDSYILTEDQATRVLAYAMEHDHFTLQFDDDSLDFVLVLGSKCRLFEDA